MPGGFAHQLGGALPDHRISTSIVTTVSLACEAEGQGASALADWSPPSRPHLANTKPSIPPVRKAGGNVEAVTLTSAGGLVALCNDDMLFGAND
jgi:hypothetical protein